MAIDSFIYERFKHNLGFVPTKCQDTFFSLLAKFVAGQYQDNQDIFLVKGYAGTGKTSSLLSLVSYLNEYGHKYILLAPTGRAAKVLSNYTGSKAYTIHKQIYRQKSVNDGIGNFTLDLNKNRDTFFIVDEASLISSVGKENNIFGSGDLLDDLVYYIRSNSNNRLILIGDSAQLPPVGEQISNALNNSYLTKYSDIIETQLTEVVRQAKDSGILFNATHIREKIDSLDLTIPKLEIENFNDLEKITGSDLIEKITISYDMVGSDSTIILCRSNRRANKYNAGIRSTILYREDKLTVGDKLMVVKNCYNFSNSGEDVEFIANGDVAELIRVSKYESKYGLNFAQATLLFADYNNLEVDAKIIIDTLDSESASLNFDSYKQLYAGLSEEFSHIKNKRKREQKIRENEYFNALQIKYANAITCHKSQGGQWKHVFIDTPFWGSDISVDDLKWLYTALTRAVDKVYFVNFDKRFFEK